jgi:hypothetical protein
VQDEVCISTCEPYYRTVYLVSLPSASSFTTCSAVWLLWFGASLPCLQYLPALPFHHAVTAMRCTAPHRIALQPICSLLIDRLPDCFIVNLSFFFLLLSFLPTPRVRIQRASNPADKELVASKRSLGQPGRPSVSKSVRTGCSSPPASARNGTCIVPCSSSSTVDTPNISAILRAPPFSAVS